MALSSNSVDKLDKNMIYLSRIEEQTYRLLMRILYLLMYYFYISRINLFISEGNPQGRIGMGKDYSIWILLGFCFSLGSYYTFFLRNEGFQLCPFMFILLADENILLLYIYHVYSSFYILLTFFPFLYLTSFAANIAHRQKN